jgi:hypothetical protein
MEQILERLLVGQEQMMERLEAKVEATQEKMETSQEMKSRLGTVVSRMDAH